MELCCNKINSIKSIKSIKSIESIESIKHNSKYQICLASSYKRFHYLSPYWNANHKSPMSANCRVNIYFSSKLDQHAKFSFLCVLWRQHDYRHFFLTCIVFCDRFGVIWVLWFQYPIQFTFSRLKNSSLEVVLLIRNYLYLWVSRSPGDCKGLCNMFEECSHWTWASGTCHLKSGQSWSKTPHKGSISGTAGQICLEQPVRGKMWCVVINHFFVVDFCCVQVVSVDMRGQRVLYSVYLLITGN